MAAVKQTAPMTTGAKTPDNSDKIKELENKLRCEEKDQKDAVSKRLDAKKKIEIK